MTSQRFLLMASLALYLTSAIACGSSSIEVPPPLAVIDTFPSNGASLEALTGPDQYNYIEIVFSELVDGSSALAKIKLASLTESDQVDTIFDLFADIRRGEAGVDEQTLSLSLLLDPEYENSRLPEDKRFRLVISKGLSAINGSVLPVDVIRRFSTLP